MPSTLFLSNLFTLLLTTKVAASDLSLTSSPISSVFTQTWQVRSSTFSAPLKLRSSVHFPDILKGTVSLSSSTQHHVEIRSKDTGVVEAKVFELASSSRSSDDDDAHQQALLSVSLRFIEANSQLSAVDHHAIWAPTEREIEVGTVQCLVTSVTAALCSAVFPSVSITLHFEGDYTAASKPFSEQWGPFIFLAVVITITQYLQYVSETRQFRSKKME